MQKSLMFRVSVRPHLHYAILQPGLTVCPVAQYDWASPYCTKPIRGLIIRRTGATKAGHPFLHDSWYDEDSGRGIVWGVLASPNLQSLPVCSSDTMWRTSSNIPDISSGQLGKEAAHYAGDPQTPSPSQSSYFYIQTMTSTCGCSLTLAKMRLISWSRSHTRIRERDETKPGRLPPVDIHFRL